LQGRREGMARPQGPGDQVDRLRKHLLDPAEAPAAQAGDDEIGRDRAQRTDRELEPERRRRQQARQEKSAHRARRGNEQELRDGDHQPRLLEQAVESCEPGNGEHDATEPRRLAARVALEELQRLLAMSAGREIAQAPLEPSRIRALVLVPQEVDALERQHAGDEGEHEDDAERDAHAVALRSDCTRWGSKSESATWMPATRNRSMKRGRTPVGRKVPSTRPCCSMPCCWKLKSSCSEIMSPSMPVVSARLTSVRVPSVSRAICTTAWMADAICWRMPRIGRFM